MAAISDAGEPPILNDWRTDGWDSIGFRLLHVWKCHNVNKQSVYIVGIYLLVVYLVCYVCLYLWFISSKHINSWQLHSCLPHVLRLFGIRRPARSPTWEHGNLAVWPKDVPLETWHYLRSENTVVPKPKPWDGLILQNVGGLGEAGKSSACWVPPTLTNWSETSWSELVSRFDVCIWHMRWEILCLGTRLIFIHVDCFKKNRSFHFERFEFCCALTISALRTLPTAAFNRTWDVISTRWRVFVQFTKRYCP